MNGCLTATHPKNKKTILGKLTPHNHFHLQLERDMFYFLQKKKKTKYSDTELCGIASKIKCAICTKKLSNQLSLEFFKVNI